MNTKLSLIFQFNKKSKRVLNAARVSGLGCIKKMKVRKMSCLGFSYVSLVETLLV